MTISEQQSEAFKEFERTGWANKGQMTRQAVDALLAAINIQPGTKLLDVAIGPGYVAAEAARPAL